MAERESEIVDPRWSIGKLYQRPESPFWYAPIRDKRAHCVHWVCTHEKVKRRAKDFAHQWIKERQASEAKKTSHTRFDRAYEEFLSLKTCREVTLEDYKLTYQGVYKPKFGEKFLDEIALIDIEKFIKKPRKKRVVGAVTKRKYLSELRSFFAWAIRHRYTTENPCDGIKVPRAPKRQGIALDLNEARKLLVVARTPVVLKVKNKKRGAWKQKFTAPDHLWLGILIALHTGLRLGNITGLRWRHLDLGKRKITFFAEEMKAFADLTIPIHPELAEVFSELLREKEKIEPDGLVLGKELHQITKSFKRALRLSGLPQMRWHDLRHTFATWTGSRAPFAIWRALLGHAPISMSEKYFHAPFEELQKVIDSMPRLLVQTQEKEAPKIQASEK